MPGNAFLRCGLVLIFALMLFVGRPVFIHWAIADAMLTPSEAQRILNAVTTSASIVNFTCVVGFIAIIIPHFHYATCWFSVL